MKKKKDFRNRNILKVGISCLLSNFLLVSVVNAEIDLKKYEDDLDTLSQIIARSLASSVVYHVLRDSTIILPGQYARLILLSDVLNTSADRGTLLNIISEIAEVDSEEIKRIIGEYPYLIIYIPPKCVSWAEGDTPVIAYDPPWDETEITAIYSYNVQGERLTLDADTIPSYPILVISGEKGGPVEEKNAPEPGESPGDWVYWLCVTQFHLYNDHEPW